MKIIELTQEQIALVDDEDFDWLSQWKWYADWNKNGQRFYAARTGKDRNLGWAKQYKVFMHREIMSTPNGLYCDHINHNGLDNQKCNLRNITNSQNGMNRKGVAKSNKLRVRGVELLNGKYRAYIRVNGKRINYKFHKELDEAICDRKRAEIKYFSY